MLPCCEQAVYIFIGIFYPFNMVDGVAIIYFLNKIFLLKPAENVRRRNVPVIRIRFKEKYKKFQFLAQFIPPSHIRSFGALR